MTLNPLSLLGRIRPRTLAGQTILVVAASLFVVQLIGFSFFYVTQRNQWITLAAAPGVIRILEALDPRERPAPWQRARAARSLIVSTQAPAPAGQDAPDVARRAAELFRSAGIAPLEVRVASGKPPYRQPLTHIPPDVRPDGPPRRQVRLSVKLQPNRWITVYSRSAPVAQPIFRQIVVQSLFLYGMVLIPLVWFTRRLAAPLRALTSATKRVGTPEGAEPVPEIGPDDVRRLASSFNAMQQRIRSMLEEKDHMLGAIGHDLRTPLTALRVRVETAADGADRDRMVATIDEMQKTAGAIDLYDVKEFDPEMRDIAAIIVDAARLTVEALPLLRNVAANGTRLHELTERLVRMEGHADEIHAAGLKRLFKEHGASNTIHFMIARELYSHLERVVDRFEDVANEIDGLVIDHA